MLKSNGVTGKVGSFEEIGVVHDGLDISSGG